MEWSLKLWVALKRLEGSVLVTGFRGFGMVGYMASKYLAMGLRASKVGFIYSPFMEPVLLVEDDGIGFPHDVYYSEKGVTVIVNRALPPAEGQGDLVELIADLAAEARVRLAILIGGLSKSYMPEGEEYGYRWLKNSYYTGPDLEAPMIHKGLGVVGPLALLFASLEMRGIPALMILPYSYVEEADYAAAKTALQVVSKLLGVEIDLGSLERLIDQQREMIERVKQLVEAGEVERSRGEKGIYM
ncbi:proteasome assembly chaperone family protein [Stetteria hydrogenophila]